METYTKIRYSPLNYHKDIKSIPAKKDYLLNSNQMNKYKLIGPQKEQNFNSNTMINPKNINYSTNFMTKNLYYQYTSTDDTSNMNYNITPTNKLFNNSMNPLNKTTPYYYSNKLKDKILNNLRDNFQADKIKKKKALYVNVNFNVNQNYSMPNYGNKNNRSLSVQNYYQNKNIKNNDINNSNNINRSSKKIFENNLINNNYAGSSFYDSNKNKTLKPIFDKEKQLLKLNQKYVLNNQNNNINNINNINSINMLYKRNPSYTKIFNYKSLEFPSKDPKNHNNKNVNIDTLQISNNLNNTNANGNINTNTNANKNLPFFINKNNDNNRSNNFKKINILAEPKDIIKQQKNKINNKEAEVNSSLYNLELKMQKLLGENKTESKGKHYNIVRKIFEESISVMNLTQTEKNFLKLIMIKYHDVVYAFSQENKALKQSSENLQNLNFSLDKKFIDIDKQYKALLKENQEMKKLLVNKKKNENENNNNLKIKNNLKENNNMYKSIKDMDFIISDSNNKIEDKTDEKEKEEKEKEKESNNNGNDNNKNYVTDKITNNNNCKNKSVDEKNKNLKSDNFRQKFEQFNRINVNDLDSLYFKDKVNNLKCYNSQKNYDKVPKIKLNKK